VRAVTLSRERLASCSTSYQLEQAFGCVSREMKGLRAHNAVVTQRHELQFFGPLDGVGPLLAVRG